MFKRIHLSTLVFIVAILALSACGEPSPAEVSSPTPVPTSVLATPEAVPSPKPSPTATATVAPAEDPPEPVAVLVNTPVPSPTTTEVVEQTATATPPPTATPTVVTREATATPTAVAVTPEPTIDSLEPSTNGGTPPAGEAVQTEEGVPLTTVEIVKILRPSVVHIATERLVEGMSMDAIPEGVGTGLILDREGHILTNSHVVADSEGRFAARIIVTLHSGESFLAEPVGSDPATDTAVIHIEAENLQPAMLGEASTTEVGEDVIAIGHALDLPGGPTVSKGVVSAIGRSLPTDPVTQTTMVNLIQTDASINRGNSGGPLANSRAEVIGINTAIIPQSQGISFAINIDDAKIIAAQLIENGFVRRGYLGFFPFNVTPALARQLELPVSQGILIREVIPGTPLEASGLQLGDIIVRLGDESVANTGELAKFLLAHPPGETVRVAFFRGQDESSVEITLGERQRE